MGMNFLNQQRKLSTILGDPNTSSDDMWPNAERKREINEGEREFAVKSKSLFAYITGVVSGQSIALPPGFLEVLDIEVNDDNLTGRAEMAVRDSSRFSGDEQYHFWTDGDGVRLLKFQNSSSEGTAYKLWYFKKPDVELFGDEDESPFEDEYRKASVFYAAAELLPQAGKFTLAEYYRNRFKEIAEEARIKSEGLYLSAIRSYPEIEDQYQYDRDKQGHRNSGIQ